MKRALWQSALVWVSAVGMGSLALGAPLARASVEDAALRGGLELLEQLGPTVIGAPQAVELNGQRIWLASKVTPLPVAEVLAGVERGCSRFTSSVAKLPESLRSLLPRDSGLLSTRGGDSLAQLACFEGNSQSKSLFERAKAFVASGDLASFGSARYVVARRDADARNTHVLALWTEGAFNLRTLFPATGDADGSDSALVSRPARSVRILCAQRRDSAGGIRVYRTPEPQRGVLDALSKELEQKGFAAASLPAGRGSDDLAAWARAYFKDGVGVILSASDGLGDGTTVSIIELETSGRAAVEQPEAP